jgi:sortase A
MAIRKGERILLGIGLMLLVLWAIARFHGSIASHRAIARFQADSTANLGNDVATSQTPVPQSGAEFALWSPKRVAAYRDSLLAKPDVALAILRIPKINLEVPVFNGTEDLTLNRGVGRIVGTAQMGQPGNLGIAGHRDGFFRGLKDVSADDVVDLVLPRRTDHYVITRIQIVNPDDVHVLDPTPTPTLTMVTCFPFYFVGSAPQRYIVTASLRDSIPTASDDQSSISIGNTTTNNKEKTR